MAEMATPSERDPKEEIWSWGAGTDGQLATGKLDDEHSPQLLRFPSLSAAAISSIACGGAHAIALTSCGKVYTWGRGSSGQLGHGDSANCLQPKLVDSLLGFAVRRASAGWNHSGFVSDCGRLFTCGDGSFGQLGHGDYQPYTSPKEVSFFESKLVVQIACGMRHSLVLVKGSSEDQIYGFGSGKRGQLGVSKDKTRSVGLPQPCLGFEADKISSICANGDHSAALSDDGQLYTWGKGFNGAPDAYTPGRFCSNLSFKQVALGWNHALLLTGDGETFMLGRSLDGAASNPQSTSSVHTTSESVPMEPPLSRVGGLGEVTVVQIAAGAEHSAIVTETGEIRTWGWGEHGQLGLGDTHDQALPQTVHLRDKPTTNGLTSQVYCGSGFTFVVKKTPRQQNGLLLLSQ